MSKKNKLKYTIYAIIFLLGFISGWFSFYYSNYLTYKQLKSPLKNIILLYYHKEDFYHPQQMNQILDRTYDFYRLLIDDPYTKVIENNDDITIKQYRELYGIEYFILDSALFISYVYPTSPNIEILKPGDFIIKLNQYTSFDRDTFLNEFLKESVNVRIKRYISSDSFITFDTILKKQKIFIPSVYATKIDSLTGYIRIEFFGKYTFSEFQKAIRKLTPIDKLILDLTDNNGGLLNSALNILGLFLPKDALLCIKTKNNNITQRCFNPKDGQLQDLKLIILTNSSTASASELLARTLQYYKKAIVIGERTYGKSLIQTRYKEAGNTILQISTSKIYPIEKEHLPSDVIFNFTPLTQKIEYTLYPTQNLDTIFVAPNYPINLFITSADEYNTFAAFFLYNKSFVDILVEQPYLINLAAQSLDSVKKLISDSIFDQEFLTYFISYLLSKNDKAIGYVYLYNHIPRFKIIPATVQSPDVYSKLLNQNFYELYYSRKE